ncbi:hypothetical protein AYI70_g9999 [Smittium culicis]|uniref:Uncharacterized protein n=1 Tax=Smittium culicis TaxID=133412 RepID=A0A1R1X8J9_9FUNG|nr:hypothetical protein AYI70_g9999 [Smittium culicis]
MLFEEFLVAPIAVPLGIGDSGSRRIKLDNEWSYLSMKYPIAIVNASSWERIQCHLFLLDHVRIYWA